MGVRPRSLGGLIGVPLMPFLHSGIGHLLSNTVPLVVLLTLLAGSRASSWQVVYSWCCSVGCYCGSLGDPVPRMLVRAAWFYGLIAF